MEWNRRVRRGKEAREQGGGGIALSLVSASVCLCPWRSSSVRSILQLIPVRVEFLMGQNISMPICSLSSSSLATLTRILVLHPHSVTLLESHN